MSRSTHSSSPRTPSARDPRPAAPRGSTRPACAPRPGALFALAIACAGLSPVSACSSHDAEPAAEAQPGPPVAVEADIGPEGGVLEGGTSGPLAGVRLVVPPGALDQVVRIGVVPTLDGAPLAAKAERVGPQFGFSPEGLVFRVPAELTVPVDPVLRDRWGGRAGDCRVWFRVDDGWQNSGALAADATSVTVPLPLLTTVAAGVVAVAVAPTCVAGPGCPAMPGIATECDPAQRLCGRRLGALPVVPFDSASLATTDGRLHALTVDASNQLSITSFDLADLAAVPRVRGGLAAVASATALRVHGRVAVAPSGEAWASLDGFGNVRFATDGSVSAFDAAGPLGVAFVPSSGKVVRGRLVTTTRDGAFPLRVTDVTDGAGASFTFDGPARPDAVRPSGTIAPITGAAVVAWSEYGPLSEPAPSQVSLSPLSLEALDVDGAEVTDAQAAVATRGRSAIFAGVPLPRLVATPHPASSLTIDDAGDVFFVDAQRAQLTRLGFDGSLSTWLLSTAAVGSAPYAAMLPRAVRWDASQKALVLVVRGSNVGGAPDVWRIDGAELALPPQSRLELTVAANGTGGSVVSQPEGVQCGNLADPQRCVARFPTSATVTLTAANFGAGNGSEFAGWSGACSGAQPTCTVTMDAARAVTASFRFTPGALTVDAQPATPNAPGGRGFLNVSAPGLHTSCLFRPFAGVPGLEDLQSTGSCRYQLAPGQTVVLEARELDLGARLHAWRVTGAPPGSDCVDGSPTCTLVVPAEGKLDVLGLFENPFTSIVITSAGAPDADGTRATGVVTASTDSLCDPFATADPLVGRRCPTLVRAGAPTVLTAVAAANSVFLGWQGDCTGTGPCALPMTSTHHVEARWGLVTRKLRVDLQGPGAGRIVSTPSGVSCPDTTCSTSRPSSTQDAPSTVTLTATPEAGSTFAGFQSSSCTSASSTCVHTMGGTGLDALPDVASATFDLTTKTITVVKAGTGSGKVVGASAGIDCGATCSATVPTGPTVELVGVPDPGSYFSGFFVGSLPPSGCASGSSCAVTTRLAPALQTIRALFYPVSANLVVTRSGAGTGSVTSRPAGIQCGAGPCTFDFTTGASVTLTATPSGGSLFAGWSGDCTGQTSTCSLVMNRARAVDASFVPSGSVVVSKSGAGTGRVTSTPAGIDCGTSCTATVAGGTQVALTATADAGSTFAGWSGACTGLSSTCTVTVAGLQSVTAAFRVADVALTVAKAGTGTGSVTSAPAGIDCGATCAANLPLGSAVVLTAAASSTSAFVGWSGACSGSAATCTVTLGAAATVTATFALTTNKLLVNKTGAGAGTVASIPAGVSCGTTCGAELPSTTLATLTATPASGSVFGGWSGDCTGTLTTCSLPMTAARQVTASFGPAATLTVKVGGTGVGKIASSPAGISCGSVCSAAFAVNTKVTLTAAAATGSTFVGWSGACAGTSAVCTVGVAQATSVAATFNAK